MVEKRPSRCFFMLDTHHKHYKLCIFQLHLLATPIIDAHADHMLWKWAWRYWLWQQWDTKCVRGMYMCSSSWTSIEVLEYGGILNDTGVKSRSWIVSCPDPLTQYTPYDKGSGQKGRTSLHVPMQQKSWGTNRLTEMWSHDSLGM